MNPFKSIEEVFPDWVGAHILTEIAVPKSIEFRHDVSSGTVTIDWSLFEDICSMVHDEVFEKFCEHIARATGLVSRMVDNEVYLSDFLKKPSSPFNLLEMSNRVEEAEAHRRIANQPLYLEILRHELGLREYPSSIVMVTTTIKKDDV